MSAAALATHAVPAVAAAAAAAAAASDDDMPLSSGTDVDDGVPPSSGTDVDEEADATESEFADDDEILVPNSPPARGPRCMQCEDRDWVWSIVVCAHTRLVEALDEVGPEPRASESDEDDDELIVRMMERAEIQGAPLRAFKRTVNMDVAQMRTMLELLNQTYVPGDWQRTDIAFLKGHYDRKIKELDDLRSIAEARALYNGTLRKNMATIYSSFADMNSGRGFQSRHDAELVYRASVAAILMTYSTAVEPRHLREFFIAEVPILRSAIRALQTRLSREPACEHLY